MKLIEIRIVFMIFFCSICLDLSTIQAAQKYAVTDLGEGYQPLCFNDNGQVVLRQSTHLTSDPLDQLFLWNNGQTTLLQSTNDWIQGASINNTGTIATRVSGWNGQSSYGCIINGSYIETIDSVHFWDINDSGQIVQVSPNDNPQIYQPQTYLRNSDGSLLDCENLNSTYTFGVAVNNNGQVTGATGHNTDDFTGFIWDTVSGKRYLSPLDGDRGALGFDINSSGQVVGYSAAYMDMQDPFNWDWNLVLWNSEGIIQDFGCKLDPMGSPPVCLNDSGQIVGNFKLPGDSDFFSYYWDEDSGFIRAEDLDSSWTIDGLVEINNQGQILGISGGHSVILTPVPEPAALSILLLGIVLLRRK